MMVTEVPPRAVIVHSGRCPRGARPRHRLPRTYHLPLQHRFIAARSGTVGAIGTLPGPLKPMALPRGDVLLLR